MRRMGLFGCFVAMALLASSCGDIQSPVASINGPAAKHSVTAATGSAIKIYFTDGGTDRAGLGGPGTVREVNPDGTGLATLVASAGERPRGIDLDDVNGHLYWNDFGNSSNSGRTLRSDLDGSNVTTLVTHGQAGINDIHLDVAAGKMYMALSVSFSPFHGVRQANLDGTGLIDLINTEPFGTTSPAGTFNGWFIDGLTVDADNGHLYYGDIGVLTSAGGPSGIVRTDLDGTNALSIVPHLDGRGRGIALDVPGGKVYFGQHEPRGSGSGNIWRVNLNGTGLEVIVSGLQRPRDLDLDLIAGKVYWVDESTRKIQRANLDGSDVEDVVTDLDGPSSLALQFEVVTDEDGDGVLDADDLCGDTVIPELNVPSSGSLNPNHWALLDGDTDFDTVKKGKGKGTGRSFNIADTFGCSCEQIIDALDLGKGHTKFGCSNSAMDDWIALNQ